MSAFKFNYGGTNYSLSGSAAFIQDNNSTTGCPPNGPEGGTMSLPSVVGNSCLAYVTAAYGGSASATSSCHPTGVTGYIDPKYVVLGVTYAPPGPASTVTYSSSKAVSITNSLKQSLASGATYAVSVTTTSGIPGFKSGLSVGYSNTGTETSTNSSSVSLSWSTTNAITTYGTPTSVVSGAYTSPVNHDYDLVYVWLNPVETFSILGTTVTWNGYGYDANDQNGLDIVGIYLGYLNGHFGAIPPSVLNYTNRAWAAGQQYKSGDSAALSTADFANIAASDPFSVSNYGTVDIGYVPPNPTTPDNRFTLTTCNSGNSVDFEQAAPSDSPGSYSCILAYSNITTAAKSYTNSSSNTFSLDRYFTVGGYDAGFGSDITVDFKYSYTVTSTTEVDSSITQTQATSSQATIIGLACNNAVADKGPCVPVYDGPIQFDLYEDDVYGTFMFAPVHYY